MQKKLTALIKSFIKPLLIVGLVLSLVLSQADGALAARSGGRIGGGSFRAPTRSMPAPSRSYRPAPSGGYYPGGGGFGLPFILPYTFIMGGGGGLFSILIFMAIAAFLVRSFRSAQSEDGLDGLGYSSTPAVSVAKVQVGLLSEARSLQADLNSIANRADTNTPAGLAQVLQESTLALMRHPEYWIYAGGETQQAKLEAAENQFNRLALAERSKFTAETLSNVNNVLKQAEPALPAAGGALVETAAPGEYIVVTMLVATQGKLVLPAINSTQDLRQALGQIGAVSSDNLMAVEILWAPQAEGDTLTSDDVVAEYPNLKLI